MLEQGLGKGRLTELGGVVGLFCLGNNGNERYTCIHA